MAKLLKSKCSSKAARNKFWRNILFCNALALGVSPFLPLVAMAQGIQATPTITTPASTNSTTILPTDIVPLADRDAFKTPIGELLQLKIMQRLPSRFYFSSSVEVTGRDETNPFQFPTKRALLAQLPRPAQWRVLPVQDQVSLYDVIGEVARNNGVFRVLPNVSGGWTVTPHTRIFTNYFMIRDQLQTSNRLNTVIHSYAAGIQQDWAVGAKGSAQFEFQGRELWQLHQQSVFDFLPGLTFSYIATPRAVLFANALVQMRGKSVFEAPTKEIDPFFTWGGLYQQNGWTFSASTTFVENFREPFHHNATIPKNSYVFISDYEVARRIVKQYPGLQAFARAEPIWNFHSHNTPSLAGMDFRVFMGMRFAMAKPALTSTLQQIREQLKQEGEPNPTAPKPSAQVEPEAEISMNPQPIHGFLERDSLAETCELPDGQLQEIADADQPQAAETDAAKSLLSQEGSAGKQQETQAPAKTLDAIAASAGAAPDSQSAQTGDNKIIDISSAKLDWNELANQASNVGTVNQTDLHSVVDQAAEATNSLALQNRSQKIQNLSAQHEKEYKLAMAPVPPPPVPMKAIPTFAPKLNNAVSKLSPALNSTPKASDASIAVNPASAASAAATPLSARMPAQVVATHAPNLPNLSSAGFGSKLTSSQLVPLVSPERAKTTADSVPSISAPTLSNADKVLQPLQRHEDKGQTYSASLAPSAIKHEKRSAEPVPLSASAPVSANVVPVPVSGKFGVSKENHQLANADAELAVIDQSKPLKAAQMHHIDDKNGMIPIEAAKLDKASAPIASAAQSASKTKNNLIASANIPNLGKPTIPQLPVKELSSLSAKPAVKPVTIASANLPPQISRTAIPQQQAPQLSTKTVPTIVAAPVVKPSSSISGYSSHAVMPPPAPKEIAAEESSVAISGLAESEISSPKIAMAVYENWQSPVLDDPLIGGDTLSGTQPMKWTSTGSKNIPDPVVSTAPAHKRNNKQADQNRTDMHLIPPFPSTSKESKDSPLQGLKLPVLPIH